MDVPIIAALTAKILVIVEGVLDYFVTIETASSVDHCGGSYGLSGTLTECGTEFVDTVAMVVNGVVEFIAPILGGLSATEYIS
jgi:hypothetical protein